MALIFPAPAQIKNLLDPTANTDAATKQYVDNNLSGGTIDISVGNANVLSGVVANTVTSNAITSTGNLSAGNIGGANLISGNYISGNGSLLTNINGSNVSGVVPNANYAAYAGNITISTQPNITSVGTLTSLSVTGNITAGNVNGGNLVKANYISGNGSLLSSITGGNVTGYVAFATSADSATDAQTVTSSSQPNITSVGTLTSLTVNGVTNLGSIGNVKITGGSQDYVLSTDGAGNLQWKQQASSQSSDTILNEFTANGTDTQFALTASVSDKKYINIHIDGIYQTTDAYSVSGTTLTFVEAPPTSSKIEVRINLPGSISTASTVTSSSQPGITSLGTLSSLTVSGNTTISNVLLSGNIIPSANVTYSLGNSTNRFKDLYLSGNTIYLGNTTFSKSDVFPFNLDIAPEVLTINVAAPFPGDDITWLWNWQTSTLPYARTSIVNSAQVSVPLYKQGTYQINNFANQQTGNMTQRHGAHLKWIDGAGLDNLVSWAVESGNVSFSDANINSGANTTVQRINVTVPANITVPTLVAPNISNYMTVTCANAGVYTFSGNGDGDNRTLGPLYRGGTYTFTLDSSLANDPFYFTTDNGTNFTVDGYFGEYTTGVTGSRNNGTSGKTTIKIVVSNTAPDVLFYQSSKTASKRGAIIIKDLAVETNVNGNYVLYFQHGGEGHKTPIEIRPIPSMVNQMCVVYDATVNKFVPQDLATYVENTPSFKNKIREVAGTATLIAPNGVAVVPTVLVVEDTTYLPLINNKEGDIAFDSYYNTIYVWQGGAWRNSKATSIQGANVSGAVANSTYSTTSGTSYSVTGSNVSGQVGNSLISGTVYASNQPNITSVGTLTNLSISGDATVTGNLTVQGTTTLINSTTVSINDINIVLANNATTSTQANGGGITINGANATMNYISSSNAFTFSHKISADGSLLSNLTGGNVSGQVGNALVAGTVYTNAQPNITSVGTLNGLVVSGNITPSANVTYSLGNSTNRFKDLYLSGTTIDLAGATIKTDSTSGAIALVPSPTANVPNPTALIISASGAISTASTTAGVISANTISNAAANSTVIPSYGTITMNQGGNITTPFTGIARCYPTANVNIVNVFASLGTTSSSNLAFTLKKNGTAVGNYTVAGNSYRLTATSANINVTTSDYLTLDITSGSGASDLKVDLQYKLQ